MLRPPCPESPEQLAARMFEEAPTVLETMFWSWMMGAPNGFAIYAEELIISDLRGPGDQTEDFVGEL